MNLVAILQLINLAAPLVKSAVEAAELAFGPGHGTEKLSHAVESVEQALPKVAELAGQVDAVRAAVKPLIEATVAAANASGALPKAKARSSSKRKARRRAA